jgi:hypothetical protein
MQFRHKRTGRIIEVPDGEAHRYLSSRFEPYDPVPEGTVAEIVAWATTPERKASALAAETAGKNRKSLIEALS